MDLHQALKQKDNGFVEQDMKEDISIQASFKLEEEAGGDINPQAEVPEAMPLAVQHKQRVQAYLQNANLELEESLLNGLVQMPEDANLEEKLKSAQAEKRTKKARDKHKDNSKQLFEIAKRTNARYEEMKGLLDANGDMTLEQRKALETNCLQSGLEGIRFLAEAEQERIKAYGGNDADEVRELAQNDLEKNMRVQQFYQQMYDRRFNSKLKEPAEKAWNREQVTIYKDKVEKCKEVVDKQSAFVEHSGYLNG